MKLRAPFPWSGDAMAYARAHVEAGVLRIDGEGQIWRDKISRRGVLVSIAPRRAENVGGKGYLRVSLNVPGHGLAIVMAHRLVYEVLVGPVPDGLQINHKDLNKQNNRPDNLEHVTGEQNIQHSYANGRTRPWFSATTWRGRPVISEPEIERARDMRRRRVPLRDIASSLGISMTHAHRLTRGADAE